MQALVGLWQIFCRQGSLPAAKADATLSSILEGFGQIRADRDVFRRRPRGSEAAAGGRRDRKRCFSAGPVVESTGPGSEPPADTESHTALVQEMIRILQASAFCR